MTKTGAIIHAPHTTANPPRTRSRQRFGFSDQSNRQRFVAHTNQAYAVGHVSESHPLQDSEIIDVGQPPRRRRWRRWLIGGVLLLLLILSRTLSIYLSAAWFSSLGFSAVYWYIFKLKLGLFITFALLTAAILRTAFWLLERTFGTQTFAKRTIVVNNQPIQFSPQRFVRPIAWILSVLFGIFYGVAMKSEWQAFALYFNQAPAASPDPIFNKPLAFYLFSLPVYDLLSGWATVLAFVILCASIAYSLLAVPQNLLKTARKEPAKLPWAAVSLALALLLSMLAWSTYLSRFPTAPSPTRSPFLSTTSSFGQ